MRFALGVLVLLAPTFAWAGPEKTSPIGKKIESFQLRDYRGAERSLADVAGRKWVVVAFVGCDCPVAKLYGPRLAKLAKEFESSGVAFLGINANQHDSITAIAPYAKR